MEDRNLTTAESITLITKMIENTRRNFSSSGGAMFLIWGYTTIAVTAAVMTLFLLTKNHDVMWLWWAIPVIGGLLTWLHFRKHQKSVRTHLDKSVGAVWSIFFSAIICCMTCTYVSELISGKSYVDILFSIGLLMSMATAITGRLINFHPVQFGGVVGMGLSFAIPAFAGDIRQIPLFACVLLVAFIIPGHLLNAARKREARQAIKGRAA